MGKNTVITDAEMDKVDPVISVRGVTVRFGSKTILNKLDLDIHRGEILAFIGPSGAGKSVLMRTILGLNHKDTGDITILGKNIDNIGPAERLGVNMRMGVLFQNGALFSGLTVLENIQVPMREFLQLPPELMDELARVKIELVGLPADSAEKYPAELSGGMVKRAALARALALDPAIVFLDEPTSGLDPISAAAFDELIADLRDIMGLTVYMVTHDLDSIYSVCDRVAALGDKHVIAEGTVADMQKCDNPWIQSYFHGKRARQLAAPAKSSGTAKSGQAVKQAAG